MIDWLLSELKARLFDAFAVVSGWVYLIEWYVALGTLLAAFVAVAIFFPFKWPRAILGGLWLLMAAFVGGLTVMFRRNRQETKALRDQVSKLRHQKQQDQGWWR